MALEESSVDSLDLITEANWLPQCCNTTEPVPQMVNSTFVFGIIVALYQKYKFRNFIFYISAELENDVQVAEDFLKGFFLKFPEVPHVLISFNENSTEIFKMSSFLSSPALCFVLTTSKEDGIMNLVANSLKTVRGFKTIFILFPILESPDYYANFEIYLSFNATIEETYKWIWQQQFLNTLLLTIDNNVFILEPYPGPKVINKTESWSIDDFFMVYWKDMQGYIMNTPILEDLPRVFKTKKKHLVGSRTKTRWSGSSAEIFLTFLDFINATLNDTTSSFVGPKNLGSFLHQVENGAYETFLNSFTMMELKHMGFSYPIGINDWCFMVPFRNSSPEYLYLQIVFDQTTWLMFSIFIIYITLAIWLVSPKEVRSLSSAGIQAIVSSVYGTPLRIIRIPKLPMRCLCILMFLYGFCLTNLYISKLSSFLTSSPQQSQIHTMDDVIDADLKLMLTQYEMDLVQSRMKLRFQQQLIVVSVDELQEHRSRMNTSFGYSITSDRWFFLNKQQSHLRKPVFRMSEICMGPYYHVYALQHDSHLKKAFKQFLCLMQQFGLIAHWEDMAFQDALFDGIAYVMNEQDLRKPLSIDFFRSTWFLWYIGIMLSGIVFIFEIKGFTYANLIKWLRRP